MKQLLFVLWFLIGFSGYNQSTKKIISRASNEANTCYDDGEYTTALRNYKILDSLLVEPDLFLKYRLGVCYRETFDFDNALNSFDEAVELGYTAEDMQLMYGKTFHLMHEFDTAIEYYQRYTTLLDTASELYDGEQELINTQKMIAQCQLGTKLKANPFVIELKHLGAPINSIYHDYGPLINENEDKLIFTSRRFSGHDHKDLNGFYHEHIFESHLTDGTNWSKPEKMKDFGHYKSLATVAMSKDGKQLILFLKQHKPKVHSGLYLSKFEGHGDTARWSHPHSLGHHINHAGANQLSACFGPDNNVIYFSSDRKGGHGGLDIYKSELQGNGHWGPAINLGPTVNTSGNEDSPFINDDVLYFSSDGHPGIGGMDLFMSVNLFDEWLDPLNFGYPINSATDDFHFIWNKNGTKGYFSSHRKDSYGYSDLYVIVRPFDDPEQVFVKGTIKDDSTMWRVSDAKLAFLDAVGDTVSTSISDSSGKFQFVGVKGESYTIATKSKDYAPYTGEVVVPEKKEYFEFDYDIAVKRTSPYPKSSLLIAGQISDSKEEMIVADAQVELRNDLGELLGVVVSDSLGNYSIEGYKDQVYQITVIADSYDTLVKSFEVADTIEASLFTYDLECIRNAPYPWDEAPIATNSQKEPIVVEAISTVKSASKALVHFEFNQYALSELTKQKLKEVIVACKQSTDKKISVVGHADQIGSHYFNDRLSLRRAKAVYDYLITNGVEKQFVTFTGKGERYPVSTVDQKLNRRVEVELIQL